MLFKKYQAKPVRITVDLKTKKLPGSQTFNLYRVSCPAKYGTAGRTHGLPWKGN